METTKCESESYATLDEYYAKYPEYAPQPDDVQTWPQLDPRLTRDDAAARVRAAGAERDQQVADYFKTHVGASASASECEVAQI